MGPIGPIVGFGCNETPAATKLFDDVDLVDLVDPRMYPGVKPPPSSLQRGVDEKEDEALEGL